MAKSKSPKEPTFPRYLRPLLNSMSSRFKDNLEGVAKKFTSHESLKKVDEKHLVSAYNALVVHGLRTRRSFERPESEAAAGPFLVGASFACPDVISTFFGTSGTSIAQFVVLLFFFVFIALF